MQTTSPQRIVSVAALLIGAVTLGMVLTGGLDLTPAGSAADIAPAVASTTAAPASPTLPVPGSAQPTTYPDFAALADKVVPSVISVYTTDIVSGRDLRRYHRNMDPFDFFFGPRGIDPDQWGPQKREGAGSGFFIDERGLALTNNHVVEGADKIQVQLADDTEYPAKIVGRDPATDVALIQVEGPGPFPSLSLGDSHGLRVGEWVMAVGNPLNMDHTVTVGVVSAKGRALGLADRSFENYVQTDAAINPGNSGGPLVNLQGQVVGINAAINIQGQNLGFAIPINTAKAILPQLEKTGKVVRGYLGVYITNITDKDQKSFNLPSRNGALVQDLEADGPADKAGLKPGDVIVAVNGATIKETRELIDRVSALPPGAKVKLDVLRDGQPQIITAELTERPGNGEEQSEEGGEEVSPTGKLGLRVDSLDPRMRRRLDLPDDVNGVVVTDVQDLSPADEAGLQPGLVITRVNGRDVTTPDDLTREIKKLSSGDLVRMYVFNPQAGRRSFFILRMP
jgi:serine protease Do